MLSATLKKPLVSKMPGQNVHRLHRAGTRCVLQRHSSAPGKWVLYFGKMYAVVDGIDMPDTVQMDVRSVYDR